MTVESLEYFYSIARGMSYLDASEKHNISQSSLSKAIFRLEDELGVKLFDRSGYRAKLTPAGRRLYEDLQKLEPAWREMKSHIRVLRADRKLSIAVVPSLTSLGISAILQKFSRIYPEVLVELVHTSNFDDVISGIQMNKYHFAITHDLGNIPNYWRCRFIRNDIYVAILPKEHPRAGEKEISFKDLVEESFILNTWGGQILRGMISASGIKPENLTIISATRENILLQVSESRKISLYYGSDLGYFDLSRVSPHIISDVPCPPWVIVSSTPLVTHQQLLEDYIVSEAGAAKMPAFLME